jgi:hypothetical protein
MSLLGSNGKSGSKGTLSLILSSLVTLVALTANSQSQSLSEVSLTYLQRHGVPCQSVVRVDTTDNLDQVAVCQDGREWVLFWLEDEVAFVRPGSRQLYRWLPDVNLSFPDLYKGPQRMSENQFVDATNLRCRFRRHERRGDHNCIRQGASCDHPSGKVRIDAAYVAVNAPIVREQLQKAGVSLAHVLDTALGK